MKKPNRKARTRKTKSPNSVQSEKLICSEFQGKSVEVTFSSINLSGDAGSLLIREAELATGIMKRMSNCFTDKRDQRMVVHKLETQVRQRDYWVATWFVRTTMIMMNFVRIHVSNYWLMNLALCGKIVKR